MPPPSIQCAMWFVLIAGGGWVEADVCLRLVTMLVSGLGEAEVSRQRPRHH